MKIKDVLKETQPGAYECLYKIYRDNVVQHIKKNKNEKDEALSTKDYKMLMKHSGYKRHRGALRQVR